MKTQGMAYSKFYWQDGYGIFSVNPTQVSIVVDYIKIRKSNIKLCRFRMNSGLFSKNTMLNTMNAIFGNRIVPFHGFDLHVSISQGPMLVLMLFQSKKPFNLKGLHFNCWSML